MRSTRSRPGWQWPCAALYGLKTDKHSRLQCPFHEDKTPSLQVYYKTQTAYCSSANCKTISNKSELFQTISNDFKHIRTIPNFLERKRTLPNMCGGFLHSQLSPVRRKNAPTGGSWPWENPWTPAIRPSAHSYQNKLLCLLCRPKCKERLRVIFVVVPAGIANVEVSDWLLANLMPLFRQVTE